MSHPNAHSYDGNSITYRWTAQGDQLRWLREQFNQYNGEDPNLFISPELAALLCNQLWNSWPSMSPRCTVQDVRDWWDTERADRQRFKQASANLAYTTTVAHTGQHWSLPDNNTGTPFPPISTHGPLYPIHSTTSLNQVPGQSTTYTTFTENLQTRSELGHFDPHLALNPQISQPSSHIPFHTLNTDMNFQIPPPIQAGGTPLATGNAASRAPATTSSDLITRHAPLDAPLPRGAEAPSMENAVASTSAHPRMYHSNSQPPKILGKSKTDDPAPRMPTEYEINHKAAHLWSKDAPDGMDWAAKTEEELKEQQLQASHRLAVQNRLVSAAWNELTPEEQQPWIDKAMEGLSAQLSVEQKNKRAAKKFEKMAASVLKEFGTWSFYVLWGKSESKFGSTVVRGNSLMGPNFPMWFNATYPDEYNGFMDRVAEFLDSGLDRLKANRNDDDEDQESEGEVIDADNLLPRVVRESLKGEFDGSVHDLRKLAHGIFVALWKSAGWDSAPPWSKISKMPRMYCNSQFLPTWWLYSNPASSSANKETLKKMLGYLKDGMNGRLPVGHAFRFHQCDAAPLGNDEDDDNGVDYNRADNDNPYPNAAVDYGTLSDDEVLVSTAGNAAFAYIPPPTSTAPLPPIAEENESSSAPKGELASKSTATDHSSTSTVVPPPPSANSLDSICDVPTELQLRIAAAAQPPPPVASTPLSTPSNPAVNSSNAPAADPAQSPAAGPSKSPAIDPAQSPATDLAQSPTSGHTVKADNAAEAQAKLPGALPIVTTGSDTLSKPNNEDSVAVHSTANSNPEPDTSTSNPAQQAATSRQPGRKAKAASRVKNTAPPAKTKKSSNRGQRAASSASAQQGVENLATIVVTQSPVGGKRTIDDVHKADMAMGNLTADPSLERPLRSSSRNKKPKV